jgi:hypothetical protein
MGNPSGAAKKRTPPAKSQLPPLKASNRGLKTFKKTASINWKKMIENTQSDLDSKYWARLWSSRSESVQQGRLARRVGCTCVRRDGSLTIEATGPPGSGVPVPCPTQLGAGLGQAGSYFFSDGDGRAPYRRESLRRISRERTESGNHGVGGAIPPLGTTQTTPAQKLRGGRWIGRWQGTHGLGPHRGLTGRVGAPLWERVSRGRGTTEPDARGTMGTRASGCAS